MLRLVYSGGSRWRVSTVRYPSRFCESCLSGRLLFVYSSRMCGILSLMLNAGGYLLFFVCLAFLSSGFRLGVSCLLPFSHFQRSVYLWCKLLVGGFSSLFVSHFFPSVSKVVPSGRLRLIVISASVPFLLSLVLLALGYRFHLPS